MLVSPGGIGRCGGLGGVEVRRVLILLGRVKVRFRGDVMAAVCDLKVLVVRLKPFISTLLVMAMILPSLAGCGVVAAPCRIGEAGARTVPVIGDVVGTVLGACADVID